MWRKAWRFAILTSASLRKQISSLTYWKKKNVRRVSDIYRSQFWISHHFLVGLKKCGRVTNYKNNKNSSSKFFKATKGAWWMPWVWEAKKGVVSCDKPGGAAHKHYIPGSPNGSTLPIEDRKLEREPTPGTETSKYREEKKTIVIPWVVASEKGIA